MLHFKECDSDGPVVPGCDWTSPFRGAGLIPQSILQFTNSSLALIFHPNIKNTK